MGFAAKNKSQGSWKKSGGGSPLDAGKRALEMPREGPHPVYLLYGDEGYLVEDTARRLIGKIVPDAQREFGLEMLSGPAVTIAQLSGALASMPLFGEGPRAVWARGCRLFRDKERADAVRALLPEKGGGATLVITEEGADKRLSLYKEIEKRGMACEFACFTDTDDAHLRSLHGLVSARIGAGGHEMGRDTFLYLVQLVGTDLRTIFTEVEKLDLHAPPGAKIGKGDIDLLVSPSRETQAFQLADAVMSGEIERSLALLRQVVLCGVHPLMILATLTRRTRFLLQLKGLMEEGILRNVSGYPAFKAAIEGVPGDYREAYKSAGQKYKGYSIFGQHPYVVFKMCGAARRIPVRRLRAHLDLLVRADAEVKRQRHRERTVLEDLVIALCGGAAVRT
ncbi:MAG: DNA polymerase III subunit delta [Chlamydiota bacterium]